MTRGDEGEPGDEGERGNKPDHVKCARDNR